MAALRPLPPFRTVRVRSAGVLAVAFAAGLLAGCGGGDVAVDTPRATAVAGESFAVLVSKPTSTSEASAARPEVSIASPTAPASVPVVSGKVGYGIPSSASIGVGASLGGVLPFAATDAWNRSVSQVATDPGSDAIVAAIGRDAPLRIGFGSLSGTPYAVVDRSQPRVAVRVAGLGEPLSWPIPADLFPSPDDSARASVIDRDAGLLMELRGATRRPDGSWDVVRAAIWRLDLADAAPVFAAGPDDEGAMPALPGLVRADEAQTGAIRHALRVTVPAVSDGWLAPARGSAARGVADPSLPPIGLRLRLRPTVAIPEDASPAARAILQALMTHGAIVVGNGPALTLQGAPSPGWDATRLATELGRIRASDFETLAADGPVLR